MRKLKHIKRILALILSVTVFTSTFNVSAFANNEDVYTMIKRLETAYRNNIKISGADLDFYLHEIYESNLMKSGMNYAAAHEAAKAYYNAMEFNLYHPEVIQSNPNMFNNAWFVFWGIERN